MLTQNNSPRSAAKSLPVHAVRYNREWLKYKENSLNKLKKFWSWSTISKRNTSLMVNNTRKSSIRKCKRRNRKRNSKERKLSKSMKRKKRMRWKKRKKSQRKASNCPKFKKNLKTDSVLKLEVTQRTRTNDTINDLKS